MVRTQCGMIGAHVRPDWPPHVKGRTERIGRVSVVSTVARAVEPEPTVRPSSSTAAPWCSAPRNTQARSIRPRSRPATRIPTTRFGLACSRQPRRRARSSTNLPGRHRRRWPRRACGRNSPSKAWIRCRSRPLPSMRRSGARSIQFSPWRKQRT
jgi:hypothetical protein